MCGSATLTGMADRSHLTPVRTTDRRVRATTVYRNPGPKTGCSAPCRRSYQRSPAVLWRVVSDRVNSVRDNGPEVIEVV